MEAYSLVVSSLTDWRPACGLDALRTRADLLARIRLFFHSRNVMEVETPLLCASSATDPHLHSIQIDQWPASSLKYLQTSPEFAMKRLLAAGSGPIFQICKAFRREERGRNHNSEFTMLEWYRPGFDDFQLMDEVGELISEVMLRLSGRTPSIERYSYQELFDTWANIDPMSASTSEIASLARSLTGIADVAVLGRDTCLDLIMTHAIEPKLAGRAVFVYHYPASQAALAKISIIKGQAVARRFELYVDGIELANGYFELTNADEQLARFDRDNRYRADHGVPPVPPDQRLYAALTSGLPECAGVALGIDRLLMAVCGASTIDEVLAFPEERA
ncbi:MAG: hypothetical protein CSA52_00740 [Gammaproteobacteria bacterium]|nr:MAG: hypothetical protein CSB48_08310 [Pseudomonadota bacterium]PIE38832.1 MAG: hypothetical protein CSA52_00740 [Gammaproteobacteria bacterium]